MYQGTSVGSARVLSKSDAAAAALSGVSQSHRDVAWPRGGLRESLPRPTNEHTAHLRGQLRGTTTAAEPRARGLQNCFQEPQQANRSDSVTLARELEDSLSWSPEGPRWSIPIGSELSTFEWSCLHAGSRGFVNEQRSAEKMHDCPHFATAMPPKSGVRTQMHTRILKLMASRNDSTHAL